MKKVLAQEVDANTFSPYGTLIDVPSTYGRYDFSVELNNARLHAQPNLLLAHIPASAMPIEIKRMERHLHSSQTFFPLNVSRYLVVVSPSKDDNTPQIEHLEAFIVSGLQGINYNIGTWHYPLTALDRDASFAALVWEDGSSSDTEWYTSQSQECVQVTL